MNHIYTRVYVLLYDNYLPKLNIYVRNNIFYIYRMPGTSSGSWGVTKGELVSIYINNILVVADNDLNTPSTLTTQARIKINGILRISKTFIDGTNSISLIIVEGGISAVITMDLATQYEIQYSFIPNTLSQILIHIEYRSALNGFGDTRQDFILNCIVEPNLEYTFSNKNRRYMTTYNNNSISIVNVVPNNIINIDCSGSSRTVTYVATLNGVTSSSGTFTSSNGVSFTYTNAISDIPYNYSISLTDNLGYNTIIPYTIVNISNPPTYTKLTIIGGTFTDPSFITINTNGGIMYTNVSNGSIRIEFSGLSLSIDYTSLKNGTFDSSGKFISSDRGYIPYTALSPDIPHNYSLTFTDATGNITYVSYVIIFISPLIYTFSNTNKRYITTYNNNSISIVNVVPNNIINIACAGLSRKVTYVATLNGVTSNSGTFTSVSGVSITYTNAISDISYNYSISLTDILGYNTIIPYTIMNTSNPPTYTKLSISGGTSSDPSFITINKSGGIMYTNVSNGSVRIDFSGLSLSTDYTSSKNGTPTSAGTFISSIGGYIPYTALSPDISYNYSLTFTDATGNITYVSYFIMFIAPGSRKCKYTLTNNFNILSNGSTLYTSTTVGSVIISGEYGTKYSVVQQL